MKKLICVLAMMSVIGAGVARAEETVGEAATEKAHDAKRAIHKGVDKVEDKLCDKGDAKCLAQKGKHKVKEGAEYVKDKGSEAKDKVDDATKH